MGPQYDSMTTSNAGRDLGSHVGMATVQAGVAEGRRVPRLILALDAPRAVALYNRRRGLSVHGPLPPLGWASPCLQQSSKCWHCSAHSALQCDVPPPRLPLSVPQVNQGGLCFCSVTQFAELKAYGHAKHVYHPRRLRCKFRNCGRQQDTGAIGEREKRRTEVIQELTPHAGVGLGKQEPLRQNRMGVRWEGMRENHSLKKNISAWRSALNGLPGSIIASYSTKWAIPKGRHLQRAVHNLRVTILCGFVTVLVLRGTIGTGTFGSHTQPADVGHGEHSRSQSQGEPRRVLSATNEQDGERDSEPDVSDGPYTLGAAISDWDAQRALWLQGHPGMRTNSRGRERMLLVTGSQPKPCDNPMGDHLLLKSLKNKVDYCRLHDIDLFYNMAHLDHEMAGFWAKLPLLRKLMLAHPEVEWLWWMDSDALFTDMVFQLPMAKYRDVNMVLHGFDEMVYTQKSWVGLNTGSFLLRNCQWSLDLLDAWAPMGPKGPVRVDAGKVLTATLAGRPVFEADDQSALIYLLLTQRGRWAPKVFLENQYYLHGYWVILVERYETMMAQHHPGRFGDDRWPFVTHFVGCKPCGSYGDYAVERCVAQMERAFNFGDNQVLHSYGFQHRTLASPKVRRLRNDTLPLGSRDPAANSTDPAPPVPPL